MCGGSSIHQNINLSENRLPKINWSIIIFPVNCNLRLYTFVLGPVSQWGFPVTEAAIQQDVRPIALIPVQFGFGLLRRNCARLAM